MASSMVGASYITMFCVAPKAAIALTYMKNFCPLKIADTVNNSVYINFENCLDISLYPQ
jgi:hypothetical protein